MTKKHSLLSDIENEVNESDIVECNKQLARPDRIGKISVMLCVVLFTFTGWHIADNFIADTPVQHVWYSKTPIVGKYLENRFSPPPKTTKLPLVGQKINDVGLFKVIGLLGGMIIGFLVGKVIAKLIRNGATQDERNKAKISRVSMRNDRMGG